MRTTPSVWDAQFYQKNQVAGNRICSMRLVLRNESELNSRTRPCDLYRLKSLRVNCIWDQSPQSNENQPHGVVCLQNIARKWCSLEWHLALTYYSKILSKNKRTISCWFDFQLCSWLKKKWDESVLLLKRREVPLT